MSAKQLSHYEITNNTKTKDIVVITENIRTPENMGMIFRIAEAFGVEKIIAVGDSPDLDNKKVLRTARNTDKHLTILFKDDMQLLLGELKKDNYLLLGLERTDKSTDLKNFNFSDKKIALFIGAERFGIDEETLTQLDATIHIELYGKNSSINVVNALGICLYEIMR